MGELVRDIYQNKVGVVTKIHRKADYRKPFYWIQIFEDNGTIVGHWIAENLLEGVKKEDECTRPFEELKC